jgi:hypothetical protein
MASQTYLLKTILLNKLFVVLSTHAYVKILEFVFYKISIYVFIYFKNYYYVL